MRIPSLPCARFLQRPARVFSAHQGSETAAIGEALLAAWV